MECKHLDVSSEALVADIVGSHSSLRVLTCSVGLHKVHPARTCLRESAIPAPRNKVHGTAAVVLVSSGRLTNISVWEECQIESASSET